MSYRVDPHADRPPSRQLVEAILSAVARGELGAGDKLPSVRAMASEALVNPNTVGKAYRELEHLGVVLGKNGSGVFVTAAGPQIAQSQKGDATLEAFLVAAREAILAGHDAEDLRLALERVTVGETEEKRVRV